MRAELLYKIADIINTNSTKYRAVIPRVRRQYMTQQGDKLPRSQYHGDKPTKEPHQSQYMEYL